VFFSEPSEGNDDGIGIAEEAVDVGCGSEPRDSVEVAELGEVGHASIVTSFAKAEKSKNALELQRSQGVKGRKVPTRKHEEPLFFIP
jgi:hypothetical protein